MNAKDKNIRFSFATRRLTAVIATTLLAIAVSVYSVGHGWFIIFQNFFYFPIIIACIYYLKRGFVFSVALALIYFALIAARTADIVIIGEALIRVALFILVAGIVTFIALRRSRAEEKLRQSDMYYNALADNSLFGVAVMDKDYRIIRVNNTFSAIFRKPADDFVGKYCFGEFERRTGACPHCPGIRAMASGQTEEVETQGKRNDGTIFYVRNRAIPFFDPDGTVKGFIETVEDIDKQKRAEINLNKEVELKNFLLDLYKKAPALADKELYDYTLESVVRISGSTIGFFHLVSDDQKEVILVTWNSEALKNCTASYSVHYPIDQAGNWVDCVRLKRPVVYNDFLRSPNRKGLPAGHTPVQRFMSVPVVEEDKVRIVFGVGNKPENYDDHDVLLIQLLANDLQRIIEKRHAEKALQDSHDELEVRIRERTVELIQANESLQAEISERKHAESVLRESEEKFAELFFKSPIPMAITAMKDGQYTEVNEAFAKVMALERGELIGNTSTGAGFITAEQRTLFLEEYRRKGYVENLELQMRVKDGRLRYGLFNSSKITIGDEDFFLTTVTDITERKRAEEDLHNAREELVRKEKLAVIGQLAGIVGHEIRNPLGVMNNAVYFLKTVMDDNDTVNEYLDIIKQEIDNSQHIVSDLLDFSRTKKPQIAPVAVGMLVSDVLGKCNIPENVSVETDIPGTLPEIKVDPFQMGQVLQNLITNAVQAMPEGGTLSIGARRVSMKEETAGSGFVEIFVKDTGEGISPENMKKLFQPLFTTKTKGIGLGLVVCKNLTEANGGKIEVESEEGKGTTFRLMLPA